MSGEKERAKAVISLETGTGSLWDMVRLVEGTVADSRSFAL